MKSLRFNLINQKIGQRNILFDIYKTVAIILVYGGHFATSFNCEWFNAWTNTYGLYGFTGKLGVAIFAVSLGFFAFRDGNLTDYILRRYLYFFYGLLMVNLLVSFGNTVDFNVIWHCFTSAVRVDDTIWGVAWCMNDFLLGSILCFLNKKAKSTPIPILLQIIGLLAFHRIWIAMCLMGALVRYLNDTRMYLKISAAIKIIFFISCLFFIQRPESSFTYILDGLAVTISLYILLDLCSGYMSNGAGQWSLIISTIGKNCMGFYLIHTLLINKVGGILFTLISKDPLINQIFVMVIVFFVIVIVAVPVNKLLLYLAGQTAKLLIKAISYLKAFIVRHSV